MLHLHGGSERMKSPVLWWMGEQTDGNQRKKGTDKQPHMLSHYYIDTS